MTFILLAPASGVHAQDTLPHFSVITKGNSKVIISWTNNYRTISQISIQRSLDSTRNFKTILTVPDPSVLQNGFVDNKASTSFMFYRLFIVLDSGKYVFTGSKRPFWDTVAVAMTGPHTAGKTDAAGSQRVLVQPNLTEKELTKIREKLEPVTTALSPPEPEKIFFVKKRDTLVKQVTESAFKAFRDSLVYKTKDTLVFASADTILIKPFVPKEVFKPSTHVFTEKDGNINIALPEAVRKDYLIKFFEENNSPLFELKEIRETVLILDKVNFLHAGWFRFELYENGKLVEKNKFYIPKDF